ncbi:MAG: hypothetical protein WCG04_01065 [Alphaproteobacteria bacterium]
MIKIVGLIGLIVTYGAACAATNTFDCNYAILKLETDTYSGRIVQEIPSRQSDLTEDLDFLSPNPEGKIRYKQDVLSGNFKSLCENTKNLDLKNEILIQFVDLCKEIFLEADVKNQQSIYMLLDRVKLSLGEHYRYLERLNAILSKPSVLASQSPSLAY